MQPIENQLIQLLFKFSRPYISTAWSVKIVNFGDARALKVWKVSPMAAATAIRAPRANSVIQFSVFTPNRLGRLNDLVKLFGSQNVHVLALTVLDTTDSSIIRTVLDDPDRARDLLHSEGFAFTESQLVVVEVTSPEELNRLIAALLEAELNINYLYSFIPHPNGKSIVGLSMEDNEVAEQVIRQHQFPVLKQSDISR